MERAGRLAIVAVTVWMTGFPVPVIGAEPSRTAVMAAVRVFGRITGSEMKIGVCREIDQANAEPYDRAFLSYQTSAMPVLARIYVLLKTEAGRFGVPQDQFIQQATDANDIAEREVRRQRIVNPGAFLDQCRSIAKDADRLAERSPSLREQMPDDMRVIDGWR